MAPKFERGFPSILSFTLVAAALMREYAKYICMMISDTTAVVTDFLHKRQLNQEAKMNPDEPIAEVPLPVMEKMAEDI